MARSSVARGSGVAGKIDGAGDANSERGDCGE
jgi:hypothetical protein